MAALPIGWGSRANAWDPETAEKESRVGDWRALTLDLRYTAETLIARDGAGVPPGWAMRENGKSPEELSMSKSACTVAVAEVVLHRTTVTNDNGGKRDTSKADASEFIPRTNDLPPVEESSMALLASALLRMDSKMTSQHVLMEQRLRNIEDRIALIFQRQERIIDALDHLAGCR